jgi:RimJ/RimL family protein N-acetyltransferase
MLKGDKVYLSPLLREDSVVLFDWINRRDLVVFNSNYKPVHEPSHLQWFDSIVNRHDTVIFGIRKNGTGQLIGSCQLNNINWIHRTAELQIRIAADDDRGKGFGREAVGLLLQFGFDDLNLNKVYLHVFADNERAIKAYEKSGFQKEGWFKQHVYVAGKYLDVLVMAIFRSEYETRADNSSDTST